MGEWIGKRLGFFAQLEYNQPYSDRGWPAIRLGRDRPPGLIIAGNGLCRSCPVVLQIGKRGKLRWQTGRKCVQRSLIGWSQRP